MIKKIKEGKHMKSALIVKILHLVDQARCLLEDKIQKAPSSRQGTLPQ